MDMNEYQQRAMQTSVRHRTVSARLTNAVIGLCGEVGELADIWKKYLYHGQDFDPPAAIEELGDILWYIAQASDALGIPLEEIAHNNLRKLQKRYPNGFPSEESK